jgi:hypothetical protein
MGSIIFILFTGAGVLPVWKWLERERNRLKTNFYK